MRRLPALLAVLLAGSVAACADESPAAPAAPAVAGSVTAAPPAGAARASLAALAAQAEDKRYSALYSLTGSGRDAGSVVATVATDASWRVDIPKGALGGTADVSMVQKPSGVYQCGLPSATSASTGVWCARVAERNRPVPGEYDPKVQRVFRQWLSVFTDRQAPIAVSAAAPLPGAQGTCFSVDSISASLQAPVDIGIYCYSADGMLTAVRTGFGTLKLDSVAPPPATVDLPAPVTGAAALGMDAPPPPPVVPITPSASKSGP